MQSDLPRLPIHAVLPELKAKLSSHQSAILSADPGSGKTTIVPLILASSSWLQGKKIIMLEPRRLAARMAAKRMSTLVGDSVGGLVGYRIRFDKKISPATQIEVVTEGIFLRMIQKDPELAEVGLVIFDEFHVRSIQSDTALALFADVLELREDLKALIMSATMDNIRISKLLDNSPIITAQGQCFPVEIIYQSRHSNDYLVPRVVRAIHCAIENQAGDILVFLPGAGEIKAVQDKIEGHIQALALYGDLPQHVQDKIFLPSAERRVILATPIAETSLTIEGVSVVIDSGLMKTPRFSPSNGLTSLHTVSISKASADQRSGRAGRLSPGVCYRLWTEADQYSRSDFLPPEILGADLAPLLLETLQWGVQDPLELTWLDPPRPDQVQQARKLLSRLGVINNNGGLGKHGKQIASLPLHPRLAVMLLYGRKIGKSSIACRLAALVQNRDIFRGRHQEHSADIEDRLEALHLFENNKKNILLARGADLSQCQRILREARQYQQLLGETGAQQHDFQEAGSLLAIAYPDRIAQKNANSRQHLLASGRGVILSPGDHLQRAEFIVAANVDGGTKQGKIFLAASLSLDDILTNHKQLLTKENKVEWKSSAAQAVSVLTLGRLEIKREKLQNADPETIRTCLLTGIKDNGIHCLGWQKKSRELQVRIETAHALDSEKWPNVSDEHLINDLSWLAPYLDSMHSLKQVKKIDLHPILLSLLPWKNQQELEQLLPTHYLAPSGSRIKLKYSGEAVVLAVRLQEMFGATETPSIYSGKLPILIHLLSPASRPVQVTKDLASFWKNTYPEVKKELAGRYPKHYWPDNPLIAQATARCKPRK